MGIFQPFKVASVQYNPQLNNLDENVQQLLHEVTKAALNGAKLIVTPEMATTGYHYENRDAIQPFVDTIPGKTTAAFEQIAKRYDTHIVIGMAEVDEEDGLYYNSAALVGPMGYIGKYRKIHQWVAEDGWSSWGDLGVPVFETSIGKISMIICMDSSFFESARLAALNGADILAFPTNSTGQTLTLLQAWAEMNGIYIVASNRSNTEEGYHMIGASAIWSPSGEKLAEADYKEKGAQIKGKTDILYAEINPCAYQNQAKCRLNDRKPELYKELMLYYGPCYFSSTKENEWEEQGKAALLQYEPVIGDKEANLQKVTTLIKDASIQGDVSLVVCPELSLTGPVDNLDIAKIQELSETIHDQSVAHMKKLAQIYHINLVFGMIERENNILFNSVVLINPEGEIALKTRKIHLTDNDCRWAKSGEKIVVGPIKNFGNIGLMVGYDAVFPETAGIMAVKQADLIIIPSSWNGSYGTMLSLHPKMMETMFPKGSVTIWDAVARLAQANTLIANYIGTEQGYKGYSALYTLDPIYSPQIPVVASGDQEEALIVNIQKLPVDWWFNQEKLLLSRRIQNYKSLVTKKKILSYS